MTREELEVIRQRANAATPGPWRSDYSPNSNVYRSIRCEEELHDGTDIISDFVNGADDQFIAHARTDVPALLDEIDTLKENYMMACECLQMIREDLAAALGKSLDGTPDMFLNDAFRSYVAQRNREALGSSGVPQSSSSAPASAAEGRS